MTLSLFNRLSKSHNLLLRVLESHYSTRSTSTRYIKVRITKCNSSVTKIHLVFFKTINVNINLEEVALQQGLKQFFQ